MQKILKQNLVRSLHGRSCEHTAIDEVCHSNLGHPIMTDSEPFLHFSLERLTRLFHSDLTSFFLVLATTPAIIIVMCLAYNLTFRNAAFGTTEPLSNGMLRIHFFSAQSISWTTCCR